MRTPKERAAAGLPEEGKKAVKAAKAKPKKITEVKSQEDLKAIAKTTPGFETDGDLVDVWSRRMLHPNQKPTLPIRLKTPGMHIRWINLTNNGRYQRARYEEGWVPVHKDELLDEREIYGVSYTTEGWVCKGEKQGEMLMKIPEAVWKKIRQAKVDEVLKSRKKIKENMQAAGAQHFSDRYNNNKGDEIASHLDSFKGDVKFGTEQAEPDDADVAVINAGLEG